MSKCTGTLSKMRATLASPISYQLPVGDKLINLNDQIGRHISLSHTGNIYCSHCGKKTKKSYAQGHCYICMSKLASCDMCMMKPETCHFAAGTCREPSWAQENCMIEHIVYLANTSGLKVGITRQVPTRWIDQGATQALPIFKVKSRHISGLVEVALAKLVADKTNWRAMLKGNNEDIDLIEESKKLLPKIQQALADIRLQYGADSIEELNEQIITLSYPVTQFPTKISSHNLDKSPVVEGILQGIKGQYLLLDTGVINIRKFSAYEITIEE